MVRVDRKSLLVLCFERTGSHLKAAKVAAFVVAWGLARRDVGEEMTVEQYADWWKQPIRSAYREQALFRETFAPLDTPDPILDRMESASMGETVDVQRLQLA